METEYYSGCCNAPPLTEVGTGRHSRQGLCMKCREGAIFYKLDATDKAELEEIVEEESKKVERKEALSIFDDIFEAFCGTKVYNKEKK